LFDLDGTLVDSERENVESVVLACRRLGAELSDDERRFIVGHSWNEIHTLLTAAHGLRVSMEALIASAVAAARKPPRSSAPTRHPGSRTRASAIRDPSCPEHSICHECDGGSRSTATRCVTRGAPPI
jgi:beta-phosphoglucomutase-like phosphatase (HAD superfamily)